jgi:hypothetical protein
LLGRGRRMGGWSFDAVLNLGHGRLNAAAIQVVLEI